jgi:hypothetical protein
MEARSHMGAGLARTWASGAEAVVVLLVVEYTAVVLVQEPEFAKKQAACMYC